MVFIVISIWTRFSRSREGTAVIRADPFTVSARSVGAVQNTHQEHLCFWTDKCFPCLPQRGQSTLELSCQPFSLFKTHGADTGELANHVPSLFVLHRLSMLAEQLRKTISACQNYVNICIWLIWLAFIKRQMNWHQNYMALDVTNRRHGKRLHLPFKS